MAAPPDQEQEQSQEQKNVQRCARKAASFLNGPEYRDQITIAMLRIDPYHRFIDPQTGRQVDLYSYQTKGLKWISNFEYQLVKEKSRLTGSKVLPMIC